jgi:bud site selection protein 20
VHKRRCKQLLGEPVYTIEEAERAAGLGKEGKRPIRESAVDAEMAVATPA